MLGQTSDRGAGCALARRPGAARRGGLRADGDALVRAARRARAGRPLLRRADACASCSAPAAGPGGSDPRPPALRLARRDARRRPALPLGPRRQALRRPDRAVQAQPPAPAPVRRPGLADRDRRSGRGSRRTAADGGRRRAGRVLHAGAVLGHRPLRRCAVRRRSCPRSTCPGTSTRRSPRTRSSRATGSRRRSTPGSNVGFCSLCIAKPVTYDFVSDVIGEIARADARAVRSTSAATRRTATKPADYVKFIQRVQAIVAVARQAHDRLGGDRAREARRRHDRRSTGTRARRARCRALAAQAGREGDHVAGRARVSGHEVRRVDTPVGLTWAGYNDGAGRVRVGSAAARSPGVGAGDVIGVEAPLWGETTRTMRRRRVPRVPAAARDRRDRLVAARAARSWAEYRQRLGAQGPLLTRLGVRFYRSPEVPWR